MKEELKMFNIVEMMHSLNHYSYEKLHSIAIAEGAQILPRNNGNLSKVELITAIIVNKAIDFTKDEGRIFQKKPNSRSKYRLEDQYNNSYFLELTEEQATFFMWCINNDIDVSHSELTEMGNDIVWEAP
jgi:hypothetical protein